MNEKKKLTIEEIFNLAVQNYQKNNFQVAENLYKEILKTNPNHVDTLSNLGLVFYKSKKYQEAINFYEKAIKIKPNNSNAHNNLGLVFYELRKYQQAVNCYEKVIQIQTNHVEAYANLGLAFKELNEFKKAIDSYEKSIQLNPNYTDAHYNLGNLLEELGEYKKAISCYEKTIQINPNYLAAYNNLGNVLQELGEYKKSVVNYEKAIKIQPNFKNAHYNLGIAFKLLKKYQKAIKSFQEIDTPNSRTELLECTYFFNGLKPYQKRLEKMVKQDPLNIKTAAMAAYVSKRENIKNVYPFCKNPLNFIFKKNIKSKLSSIDKFSENLLKLLRKVQYVWEPLSTTTKGGYQTIGNLFDNNNIAILGLQKIIEEQIAIYRDVNKSSEEYFIKKWPSNSSLIAWHVKLLNQGQQKPHIHPKGWLSGVFYVKVPKLLNKYEGSIKFQLYGYDYPEDKNLPNLTHIPKVFDLVLFPSSLFHRTIPFISQEERHSIAFDLIPK